MSTKETHTLWPDQSEIVRRIYECDDYIVFIDADGDLDWADKRDVPLDPRDKKELSKVLSEVAKLEGYRLDYLDEIDKISYKRMLGEAIAHALGCEKEAASKTLDYAASFWFSRSKEQAKILFLQGSAISSALTSIVWWIVSIVRQDSMSYKYVVIYCAFAGCIGSLYSILLRMSKLNFEPAANKRYHYLEGVIRIGVGFIASAIAGMAIQTGIVKSGLASTVISMSNVIFIGICAGASERFVPSLVEKTTSLLSSRI